MRHTPFTDWYDGEDYLADDIADIFEPLSVPVAPIEIDGELPDLEAIEYVDIERYVEICGDDVVADDINSIEQVELIDTEADFDPEEVNDRYWA